MGKIDIGFKYESLVTSAEHYTNLRATKQVAILAIPTSVLDTLRDMFEQNEEYISYDAYGKAIQFDPDCNDAVNNLFDAIFEGQKMKSTYEVHVRFLVEADNEEDAERMVNDGLFSARGLDDYDIESVEEYD